MKEQFAKGLFIRNDEEGHPCRVGDVVEVTRGAMKFESYNLSDDEGTIVNIDECSYRGILCLLKSKGVCVRLINSEYIKPNLTNLGLAKWKWKLIESKNE
jgi:hypothetical protein